MHVAAIQYDIVWEDKLANHAIVERMLEEAALPRGTFILLPELGDTGFSFNLDVIVDDRTLPWATKLARRLGMWIQVGHAIRGSDGRGRNVATIISPSGMIEGAYQKIHPFSFGREIEHFTGGERIVLRCAQNALLCPLICYDLRFPELWRFAAVNGAEVFTIGASWPAARQHHWRTLLIARAIENQAYVVAVNRVGNDPHLAYSGGSIIVSPKGDVLAEAGDRPAVIHAELSLESLRGWRHDFPALKDIRRSLIGSMEIDRAGEGGLPLDDT